MYSTSATPAAETTAADAQVPVAPKAPREPPANIYSSLILSRIPIVTPELTDFEAAYYKYQSGLERKLMWTFPSYFYFKKGTLSERKFAAAQKGPVTRQPGVWYPNGIPDVKFNRERRLKQDVVIPRETPAKGADGAVSEDSVLRPIVGNPRVTEADKTGDIKALTRRLDRTLYLLVKQKEWKFPSFSLAAQEPLHEAAERGLRELGGPNMYTWTVSNTPCAVLRYGDAQRNSLLSENFDQSASKEYLIKSHIIHGTFVPAAKDVDFAWLTKEEIKDKVSQAYWSEVEVLLSQQ